MQKTKKALRILGCTLAGFAGGLAYPPFSTRWPWLAVAAQSLWLSTMLWLIFDSKSARQAFWRSWGLGTLASLFSLSWLLQAFHFVNRFIETIGPYAFIMFCMFLSLFVGAIGAATFKAPKEKRYVAFAFVFATVEWIKSWVFLDGFPWNPASLVWSDVPAMYQSLSLFGTFGLTFLTVFLLSFPYLAATEGKRAFRSRTAVAALSLLILNSAFGLCRLSYLKSNSEKTGFKARLVNAAIRQSYRRRGFEDVMEYMRMSRYKGWENIDLFVWPENAVFEPFDKGDWMESALADVNNGKSWLVTGHDRMHVFAFMRYNLYNSMSFISKDGIAAVYDKVKLVPFGEYLPSVIRLIPGVTKFVAGPQDFSHGAGNKIVRLGGFGVYPLVCYEIIFPGMRLTEEVDFIVNGANEEWFSRFQQDQSLGLVRYRAVEEGVPVIRVTNMSLSAVVDPSGALAEGEKTFPDGRTEMSELLSEKAVMDVDLPKRIGRTIFSRTGNRLVVPFLLIGLLFVYGPLLLRRSRKAR
ncbi:MAG: apolipoprotein N-acyltransferase [Rickettsiales bacterium]|jgi:apolipoprotein N-acyltransferase|nr:apolipoprotein N-acyltransferase [Rickettsiales bacterium]